jgi:hypothetical protein
MRVAPKLFVLLGFVFAAGNGWSQADQNARPAAKAVEQAKYYRLDFVVKETEDGKQVSARNYSLTASTGSFGNNCSVRAGDKIPVPSANSKDASPQFTYIDVGVNIDCRDLKDVDQKLALRIQADISGSTGRAAATAAGAPIIRQFRWSSDVLVPLRKATVIYQSDGASSKSGMQLELTATPLQ